MLFSKFIARLGLTGCVGVMVSCLVIAIGMAPLTAGAQVTTASIGGNVTDQSGAKVPNALVVITSTTTGATRATRSNKAGDFSFSAVESGDYSLTITAKGFGTISETGIHLDPADQRTLRDLKLDVGAASDVVTVDATDAGISTDGGEISSLISAEDIQHLAIEGRDVTELLKIIPGFTPISTGVGNSVADPSQVGVSGSVGQYSGNGSPLSGVALLFDGADVTDPGNFGATIQTVNYDQVAEVKVQTASVTADTAHGPIIINALGAYGGSAFHGSAYIYARESALNSTDWYANYTGQGKPNDRQLYPGFTFGGPVVVPFTHFNENKKLNFWVGAEDYAQRNVYAYGNATSATLTALVPTAAMRKGDFSQTQLNAYLGTLCTGDSTKSPAIPPNANFNLLCSVPTTGPDGSALTNGNVSSFLDPGAVAILNALPLPTPGLIPSTKTPYNWVTTNTTNNDLWQMRGRLDYALFDKTKLFGVYSGERGVSTTPQLQYYSPRGVMGGINYGGGLVNGVHTQLGAFNASTIISSNLTNEFYASASYFKSNTTNKTNADTLTGAGYPYVGAYRNGSQVLPQLTDYSYHGLPVALFQDQGPQANLLITKFIKTAGDNVTYQLRTHTLRAGAYVQSDINNQPGQGVVNTNGSIDLYYFGASSVVNGKTIYNTAPNGGNYLANFAEGHISDYNQTNVAGGSNLYFWNYSGYVQDHWRILAHLSMDYGVRFEHITPWTDSHGIGVPVWDPKAYSGDLSGSPLPGFLWHSIDQSVPLGGFNTRPVYIEPRVGFSWDPLKKGGTILRGGFGEYRAHDSYNDASSGQANAQGVRTFTLNNTTLSAVALANVPISTGSASYSAIHGVLRNDDEMPQVKTWDLAVVQKLPYKTQLQMAYVGSYSNFMLDDGGNQNVNLDDQNALPVGAFYSTGQYSTANYGQVSSLTVPQQNAFRKYPLYKNVLAASHRLYSNYNGLQTSLIRQAGPVRVNVNYTFSKALGVLGAYQNGHPTDPFNLRNDYLPEGFDRTHVFNASYTWQVGKHFTEKRILSVAVSNWEISGITNYISGQSMQAQSTNFGVQGTIIGAPNTLSGVSGTNYTLGINDQTFLGTPDVPLQPRVTCNPAAVSGSHHYFNSACFSLPTQIGVNGTYRFPYIHGPAFFNTDLSVQRNFPFSGKKNLFIRVAAFNFINHANSSFNTNLPAEYQLNFGITDPTITNPASPSTLASIPNANAAFFGTSTLKAGRRIAELTLKYTF
jgi:hypothetical protein